MNLDLDFYKEQYRAEYERRNALRGALTLPVGILTLLAGGIWTMANGFSYLKIELSVIFVALIIIASCMFVMATFYLVISLYGKSTKGYTYQFLPASGVLIQFKRDLDDYYLVTESNDKKAKKKSDREFDEYLLEHLAEATDINTAINDLKSESLSRANGLVILLLLAVASLSLLYTLDARSKPPKVHHVQLTNASDFKIAIDQPKKEGIEDVKGTSETTNPSSETTSPTSETSTPAEPGSEGIPNAEKITNTSEAAE